MSKERLYRSGTKCDSGSPLCMRVRIFFMVVILLQCLVLLSSLRVCVARKRAKKKNHTRKKERKKRAVAVTVARRRPSPAGCAGLALTCSPSSRPTPTRCSTQRRPEFVPFYSGGHTFKNGQQKEVGQICRRRDVCSRAGTLRRPGRGAVGQAEKSKKETTWAMENVGFCFAVCFGRFCLCTDHMVLTRVLTFGALGRARQL